MNAAAGSSPRPPALLRRLMRWSIPARDRDLLVVEIDDIYRQHVMNRGRTRANLWHAGETVRFTLQLGLHRRIRSLFGSLPAETRVIGRSLWRAPTFTFGVVITVALAAGVLTAVYCAANWVLFRPVPGVHQPGQLATLRLSMEGAPPFVSFPVSEPDRASLAQRVPELSSLAGITPYDVDIAVGADIPRRVAAEMVSTDFFRTLGTRLVAGTTFTDAQAVDGAGAVAVVSWDLARSLDAVPGRVVGTTLRINSASVQIIGVTAPGFRGAELPGSPLLWLPLGAFTILDPTEVARVPAALDRQHLAWRRMIGRVVRPGDIAADANRVRLAVTGEFRLSSYSVKAMTYQVSHGAGLDPAVRASARQTLTLLLGASALLLLLGTANVANLVGTRSLRLQGNLTIRATLGATRARITRSLLIEVLMLGAVGGFGALGVTGVWLRLFAHARLAEQGGSLEGVLIDARVAAFGVAVGMVSLLLAYLRPLHRARHALDGRAWKPLDTHAPRRGQYLVGTQVAISVTLLVSAMLLARTVHNLRRVDLGFDVDHLVIASFDPWVHGFDRARVRETSNAIEQELRARPGVAAAGLIAPTPLGSSYVTASLASDTARDKRPAVGAGYYVTPGLLDALGVESVAGERPWRGDSGTVAITTRMLRLAFPGVAAEAAVGRQVYANGRTARITAVVRDVHLSDLTSEAPATIFFPIERTLRGEPVTAVVRTGARPATTLTAVQEVVGRRTAGVPVYNSRSARSAVDLQFSERQVMASTALQLSVLGALLAMVGLYGVLANTIAARQRDLAIRQALGATAWLTTRAVLPVTLTPTVIGTLVGCAGAYATGRLLQSHLYGLGSHDTATFASVVLAVAAMTGVASAIPIRRALQVSPASALRGE